MIISPRYCDVTRGFPCRSPTEPDELQAVYGPEFGTRGVGYVALHLPRSSARAHTVDDALEEVLDRRWVKHFGKWDRIGLKRGPPNRSPPTGTARSTDDTSRPS